MSDDNIFNFEEFRKRVEKLQKEQQKSKNKKEKTKQQTQADGLLKMLELYNNLFTPPSQEEIDKAVADFADSLESVAKTIRSMQSTTAADESEKKSDEDEDGGEE